MKKFTLTFLTFLTFVVFIVTLFVSLDALAQFKTFHKGKQHWALSGGAGTAVYGGDLAVNGSASGFDLAQTGIATGIDISRKLSPIFSVRTGLSYMHIKGNDFSTSDPSRSDQTANYYRNLHFRNNIVELSAVGMLHFIPNFGYFKSRTKLDPYMFTGIAAFYHNPQAKTPVLEEGRGIPGAAAPGPASADGSVPTESTWVDLRPLQTEGTKYSSIAVSLPFGLGLNYMISEVFNLGLEVSYRLAFTDYLDDVSGNYADMPSESSDLARIMANRSAEKRDGLTGSDRNLTQVLSMNGTTVQHYQYSDNTLYSAIEGYTPDGSVTRGNPNGNTDGILATSLKFSWLFGARSPLPKMR